MKFAFVTAFALSALSSTAARASTVSSDEYFAVDLQYSSVSYSKPVKSVLAHVGVLTQYPSFDTSRHDIWQNIKDIELAPSSNGFSARTALRASGSDGSYATKLSPVVVYFVNFEDGTSTISDEARIADGFSSQLSHDVGFNIAYDAQKFLDASQALLTHLSTPTSTKIVLKATSFDWNGVPSKPLSDLLSQTQLSTVYPN